MPDHSNTEVPRNLGEHKERSESLWSETVEIGEALVLAIVAVATAWSGYQAARWTGYQAQNYGIANRLRVQADEAATAENQERLYIASTVVQWLKAEAQGQYRLAVIFERRILPDFRPAFEAWEKTDPVHNPNAPAGPQLMSGYRSPKSDEADKLNRQAEEIFEGGNVARERSDEYVRVTVILATVLLLIAVSQHFKAHRVRICMLAFAAVLLCFPMYVILQLPRL